MPIPTCLICSGALDPLNKPESKLDGLADARRLQLLIDAIVDYAIYMIDVDGTVRSWNSGAERLKGYSAGATEGLLGQRSHWQIVLIVLFARGSRERSPPNRIEDCG